MRYKLILIDADDTLFDFQTANRIAVAQMMDELGLASPTVFSEYQSINHACWTALERGEMTQEQLHVERFRRFLAAKGLQNDPAETADRFAQILGEQRQLLPHAEAVVRALAERRPVAILTNGITAIQKLRMSQSPLRRYISRMVISQEVGVSKPDPRIFDIALEGVPASEALMIGDGLKSDILGANRAGVDACWLNPEGKALPADIHAEYVVSELTECLPIALA